MLNKYLNLEELLLDKIAILFYVEKVNFMFCYDELSIVEIRINKGYYAEPMIL
ncbi:Uncharacterised protein [Phocoenobacter uteri]|uniref:Uncharacterized protein n=1 Tax=Phocoenobacter uteri TaxID=146806 RepID=A0A379CAY6_9PAST|nr:Uncharacterised protein [Phocoenobacter uteri]